MVKTVSVITLTHYLPFSLSFFHKRVVELSRGYTGGNDVIALTAKEICAHGYLYFGFSGGASGKKPVVNAGDERDGGSSPGSGRSPGGGHGIPLQCSCLENPMDRGAW